MFLMGNAEFELHKSSAFFINNHDELILRAEITDFEDTSGNIASFKVHRQLAYLFKRKPLRANHRSVRKDIHPVSACREIFLYIPEYSDSLFFSVVFDVFLDRIGE